MLYTQPVPCSTLAPTPAGLAVGLECEAAAAAAVVPVGDAHTLVLAAVVPEAAVINHWGDRESNGRKEKTRRERMGRDRQGGSHSLVQLLLFWLR